MTSEDDDFSNDQLCDTSGVRKRGVEDGDTVSRGIFEVDLVGTNTEASHDNQVLCFAEDSLIELGFRSDSNDVDVTTEQLLAGCDSKLDLPHVPDLFNQLVLWQRRLKTFNLVALSGQDILTTLIDIFQQQDLDVLGVERLQLLWRSQGTGQLLTTEA